MTDLDELSDEQAERLVEILDVPAARDRQRRKRDRQRRYWARHKQDINRRRREKYALDRALVGGDEDDDEAG